MADLTREDAEAPVKAAIMGTVGIAALYTAVREWDWFIAVIGLVLIYPAVSLGWNMLRKATRHAP